MTTYGVCPSSEERCGLSFESARIDRLFELLRVIQARSLAGGNSRELLPHLRQFVTFFQSSDSCGHCGQPLSFITQPTAGLDPDSAEYRHTRRVNELLDKIPVLQNLGILDF